MSKIFVVFIEPTSGGGGMSRLHHGGGPLRPPSNSTNRTRRAQKSNRKLSTTPVEVISAFPRSKPKSLEVIKGKIFTNYGFFLGKPVIILGTITARKYPKKTLDSSCNETVTISIGFDPRSTA